MSEILRVESVSKMYRLGQIGTGTLSHDLNRLWYRVRGKEDPYAIIGEENDRSVAGGDYVWALKDVSFSLNVGDAFGIVGGNGAGKSTLLKILSRVTGPTTGKFAFKGRIASLLEVGTGFHPELTGRENIFLNGALLGMTKSEVSSKLDEIVDFAGVAKYIDTPVKRYSSGMTVRLGFAVAAHLEPEILIVDEVLAVGDADFQEKCISKMRSINDEGRTILFVSHNMSSINRLCNRGVLIDKGQIAFEANDIREVTNEYLNRQTTVADLDAVESREGNGLIQLHQIRVLDQENRETSSLTSGERISIILDLFNHTDVEVPAQDFEVRVLLRNREDFVISMFHSRTSPDLTALKVGKNAVSIEVPKFAISKDFVFVDVAIRHKNILTDRIQRVLKLPIVEGPYFTETNFSFPKFFRGAFMEHYWRVNHEV